MKTSEKEITIMKNEIEKLLKEKSEEKTFRMKIAERLKMLIDDKNSMETTYKLELQQVSCDFEDLKQHLLHITRFVSIQVLGNSIFSGLYFLDLMLYPERTRRCFDVVTTDVADVHTTLYQRQKDVVCLQVHHLHFSLL